MRMRSKEIGLGGKKEEKGEQERVMRFEKPV